MNELLQISFQAGALAALVWLTVQALGRWLSPRARYTLWFLVLIRLVLWTPLTDPLAFERPDWWTWNIDPVPEESIAELDLPISAEVENIPADVVASAGLIHIHSANSGSNDATTSTVDEAPLSTPLEPSNALPSNEGSASKSEKRSALPLAKVRAQMTSPVTDSSSNHLWLWLWLAGTALMLTRAFGSEWSLRRKLKAHAKPAPDDARQLIQRSQKLFSITATVSVFETDLVSSPAAYGLLKPKILLPIGSWQALTSEERELVILHELAHLKHKDAWTNWLMALLQAAHWFNPFIYLAFTRLRAEREVVRDCEALQARPGVEPTQYAATILKMLPRTPSQVHRSSLSAMVSDRNTTRKRITMIMKNQTFKKPHLLLGATCFALLGWAGLTSANVGVTSDTSPENNQQVAKPASTNAPLAIRVTRQNPEPEWRQKILAKLDQMVEWQADSDDMGSWAEWITATTDLKIAIDPDVEFEHFPIAALPHPVSVGSALDLVCWQLSVTWDLLPSGILIHADSESRAPMDLRFYDVRPLVQGDGERADRLMDIVQEVKPNMDVWREGSEFRYWDGQLLVKQSDDIHRLIAQSLNLLLSGESPPIEGPSPQLRAALKQPVQVKDGEYALSQLAEQFTAQTGAPILIHGQSIDDDIVLEIKGAPLEQVLQEMAHSMELRYQIWNGAICMGRHLPTQQRSYEVGDLVEPSKERIKLMLDEIRSQVEAESGKSNQNWIDESIQEWIDESTQELRWEKVSELEDLMYSVVDTMTWEEFEGVRLTFWDDRMIVNQISSTHELIETFLSAARRATQ
ncbi:MAG: M56 family metallopeptidase [Planctomycetes bacterium]|nr:M56 family metallopeptidase [Planctomycetota bacterium]